MHADAHAAKLTAVLPANAVVAMGDLAGSLGYRLQRPMVQTEDLVEGPEYLRRLRQLGSWQIYFAERGVTYIAAADMRLSPYDDGAPNCHMVVEPKVGAGPKVRIRALDSDVIFHDRDPTVWRYRPAMQFAAR